MTVVPFEEVPTDPAVVGAGAPTPRWSARRWSRWWLPVWRALLRCS